MSVRQLRVRCMTVATTLLIAAAAVLVGATPAAASGKRLHGAITSAVQHRNGTISVTGWAYDWRAQRRSVTVCAVIRRHCVRKVRANGSSRRLDRKRHIRGRHRFTMSVPTSVRGPWLVLRLVDDRYAHTHALDARRVKTAGQRVVAVARRYVGHARYREGGASPSSGFDCSGYTLYAFDRAHVARLPHNAQAQRFAPHMHRIRRSHARAGDLVFYLAGGYAYHVAIYAGHGMQYAAATPRDGIRYQPVWSSRVEYRTDWH